MTTTDQITAARQVIASMPLDTSEDAVAAGRVIAGLSRWRTEIVAAEAARARDLDAALIIADHVDGDPDDYIDAIPALREYFAQPVDTQDADQPEPAAEPPVGTRLRDRFGSTWVLHQLAPNSTGWHTTPTAGPVYAWDELRDQRGPLHQVWVERNQIPMGTVYRDCRGALIARTGHEVRPGERNLRAPFTAVLPYGEVDQ